MLNSLSFGSCFVFVETVDLELIVRNNKEMYFHIFGQAYHHKKTLSGSAAKSC